MDAIKMQDTLFNFCRSSSAMTRRLLRNFPKIAVLTLTMSLTGAFLSPVSAGSWEVEWREDSAYSSFVGGISGSGKGSVDWNVKADNTYPYVVAPIIINDPAPGPRSHTHTRTFKSRLHWIRDHAADMPPKVAIVAVRYTAYAGTSTILLPTDDPEHVDGFTATVSTTVGEGTPSLGIYPSQNQQQTAVKKSELDKTRIFVLSNPDQNEYLDVHSATATLSYSGDAEHPLSWLGSRLSFIMSVKSPQINLLVRRRGSGNVYSSETTAAAGSFEAQDEHAVDVRAKFSVNNQIINIEEQRAELQQALRAFEPELIHGNGVQTHSKFVRGSDPDSPQPNDSIYLGKFISSDRDLNSSLVVVQLPEGGAQIKVNGYASESQRPGATIQQLWDQEGDWKSGSTGEEPFDPYINYDEPTPITFRPKFSGVPITGHSIKIGAKHVQVLEWDEALETSVTRIYTTVARLQNLNANPPVIYKEDLGEYVTGSPGVSSDLGGGVYRTTLTVPFDPDKIVQDITLKVEDQQVYRAIVP